MMIWKLPRKTHSQMDNFVQGLYSLADGIIVVLTLGFLQTDFNAKGASRTIRRRVSKNKKANFTGWSDRGI